jgi:hypothetical protein
MSDPETTTISQYCTKTGRGYTAVAKTIKNHELQPVGKGGRNNSAWLYATAELDRIFAEHEAKLKQAESLMNADEAVLYTGYSRSYIVSNFEPSLIVGKCHFYDPADLDAGLRRDGKLPRNKASVVYCCHCGLDLSQAKRGAGKFCGDCIRELLRGKKLQIATAGV